MTIYSERPYQTDIKVSSLVELLQQRAAFAPEGVAYRFLGDGETVESHITYAELNRRARSIAGYLQETCAHGERALLLYPAGLAYVEAFFGCLYAGVVAVPAYPPRLNRNALRLLIAPARRVRTHQHRVADRHRICGGRHRVVRDRAGDRGGDHHSGCGDLTDAGAFADHVGRVGGGAGACAGGVSGEAA